MNERELFILNKCINTVSLKPAEINDYMSMCEKLNKLLEKEATELQKAEEHAK